MGTTITVLPDYPDGPIPGFPGDLADIGLKDTISRRNTGTKPIPFGAAVIDGPADPTSTNNDLGCALADGVGRVIGFAKSDYALHPMVGGVTGTTATPIMYQPGDAVQVVRAARMREHVDVAAVKPGDPVKIDPATGLPTGSHNAGMVAVPGCTWETNSAVDHVGIIQILLPA